MGRPSLDRTAGPTGRDTCVYGRGETAGDSGRQWGTVRMMFYDEILISSRQCSLIVGYSHLVMVLLLGT